MFENLKVLELASVLAGPSVGQFFAELGAEVIKVENATTGGDVTRSWKLSTEDPADDRSAYFCSVNWGKKSIALDLSKADDFDVVKKLVAKSDVVIASYKPGDAEKLGVSYEKLKEIKSTIIYGQITGYGPDSDRVGYDAIIQAESGFMDINGEPQGEPLKMPVALVDVLASHHLKEGLLLALLKKEQTGEGSFVEVSLIQAAISSLVNQATNWLVAKSLPQRQGSLHPNISPYGEVLTTRDNKKIILAVGSDRQFFDLCEVLQVEHLKNDERFKTNQLRVKNRSMLKHILIDSAVNRDSAELLSEIHKRKIPAGVIQNMKEVFDMPEAQEILLSSTEMDGVRNLVAQSEGLGLQKNGISTPPRLGEHSMDIKRFL